MAEVIWEAVLIGTAGVRKCRLRMRSPHMLVKWLVYFGIVHLLYKALRDCPACVQNLWHTMCTEPMDEVVGEAVLIRTAGVQKYRLRMSAPHMLVTWLVHFRDRPPKVKGATGLPRMCTEPMAQDVYRAYG